MSQLKEDEYWKRCIKYKNPKAKENPRLNFDDGIKLNRAKKQVLDEMVFTKVRKGKQKFSRKPRLNERKRMRESGESVRKK